jgi:hypothetical protein
MKSVRNTNLIFTDQFRTWYYVKKELHIWNNLLYLNQIISSPSGITCTVSILLQYVCVISTKSFITWTCFVDWDLYYKSKLLKYTGRISMVYIILPSKSIENIYWKVFIRIFNFRLSTQRSLPARSRDIVFLCHRVHTGPGAHRPSYEVRPGELSPEVRRLEPPSLLGTRKTLLILHLPSRTWRRLKFSVSKYFFPECI